ncbi:MAG TPA: carboxypeptidase regulatory-like domain-containing protein [Candidatus Acidoferrum sp.]|jgi:hypothetical protein
MWRSGFVAMLVLISFCATQTRSQSLIAGDIAGTVVDPSGAAVPDASVVLKSLDTGAVIEGKTSSDGYYRFSLLKPGRYEVTVSKGGFKSVVQNVEVNVGKTSSMTISLEISSKAETIEVTTTPELLNTETSTSTSFTQEQVAKLPNPGGDITNIAFTAPGVLVASAQPGMQGYGNFTANGLPGTSNLFTTNGENTMDPYFNINNTGATNLTLGSNEVQEATVITNPYSAQYGQLSGAQVSFITKSGTNQFHGNAQYWWNGRYLNANDFFNKWTVPAGQANPAPFSNANQWATAFGGPVIKDKTFFFVDYEGMRFVLPSSTPVYIPTPAFATAVLNNIQNTQPAEFQTYQTMLNLYENAKGASGATPLPSDKYCKGLNLPGFDGTTTSCVGNFVANPTALATEWILAARVDQKIGSNDSLFGRFKLDHGLQPSLVDPISPNFSALSNQPAWDVQVNEAHTFNSTMTNVFTAAGSHYVAQFAQNHQLANSTFPYDVVTSGFGSSVPWTELNQMRRFPQGRNITQYQFIDDFSWSRGRHTFKFGANFRRYDVSDHNFFYTSPTVYFGYTTNGLQQFADGLGYQYRQADTLANNVPIANWGLGLYAEDQIKLKSNFTLTLALRVERTSNPVCQKNCFANFTGTFSSLASYTSADPKDVPYSQDIKYNQHQAFQGVDAVDLSPRISFSWAPGQTNHFPWLPGGGKTVISGGFGMFYDNPAISLVDNLLANPPVSVTFRVRPTSGVLPFDPAGGAATWQAAANAFDITKSFNEIQASMPAGVSFAAPAFNSVVGTVHAPRAYEWNFQIQQEIGRHTALQVNYVGNSVQNLPYSNTWGNAWDQYGIFATPLIPLAAPDGAYGTINQVQSGAISNYNGLTVTLREQIRSIIVAHLNYTYSHNLDESSNGGLNAYGFAQGQSIQEQLNPASLRAGNYGNTDYDIRHLVSADYVITPTFHRGNGFVHGLINGWEWSGKAYWHTGLPYSIQDGNISGAVGNGNGTFLGTLVGGQPAQTGTCGKGAINTPCLNAGAFYDTSVNLLTAFPNQTRNQYHGAGYFDMDMGLFKNIKFKERMNLGVGLMAFNVFNHPNMPFPNNTFSTGDSTFGTIVSGPAIGVPTSPYGNFLGFDSSPRIVQLSAKITF